MKEDFTKDYWQGHYKQYGKRVAHLAPNTYVVDAVQGVAAGVALDAGCGEGADAMWLAGNGWTVQAVDISDTAIRTAKHTAETLGLTVDFSQADLTDWQPQKNHFDLVSAQYVHATDNQQFVQKIASAVRSGGTLLIVGHQPPKHGETDNHAHGSHITAEQVAAFLDHDEWEIQIAEPRTSEKIAPDDRVIKLDDSVLKARRK